MNIRQDFTNSTNGETSLPVVGVIKGLPDHDLLDLVQRQTLRYFWDHGHPLSGMARERRTDEDYTLYDCSETVTTGGTGFGIMGMLAGVERAWLKRDEVCARLEKIVSFLEKTETHHGVFPHFIDSRTGRANFFESVGEGEQAVAVPVAERGGNLVETAFLFMGLLTARQYFSKSTPEETDLRKRINRLWHHIEWDSHLSADGKNLQWLNHPETGLGEWPVTGWNEAVITHVLAASSPTHAVSPDVYRTGWCSGMDFYKNGDSFYGIKLPLGPAGGGPLFFSHYSFLGLDPRGLKDGNASYWKQNVAHTLINRAYCIDNPAGHAGYGANCWGLTASDTPGGYNVHAPVKGKLGLDNGTITPTAALSSFPYTPIHSMEALRHFYEDRGDDLWTEYGFVDAFNPSQNWVAPSHLAIDQGPIVAMIENHRSGLLWNLFMSCPEVKFGLNRLGFESPHLNQPELSREKTQTLSIS
ncbi:MAG: beta-glucosidase [Micavibrio aeruginosavorus]|uniref:Beta-glucosidase n=1 Tax=Micavibrio aeruginosavorus TaxID=349221 RepID=A0A2W4ZVU4_9BACT|nr:MAG: beta-glucosidase [Micavibrio aeruginosavorus]